MRRRTSAPPGGRYPPSSCPTRWTVPPHATLRGHTRTRRIFAGTTVVTCPLDGRMVAVPLVTARIIRDGPGGIVALQLPFAVVVAVPTWLNASVLLFGAAKMCTGSPGSVEPVTVVYR